MTRRERFQSSIRNIAATALAVTLLLGVTNAMRSVVEDEALSTIDAVDNDGEVRFRLSLEITGAEYAFQPAREIPSELPSRSVVNPNHTESFEPALLRRKVDFDRFDFTDKSLQVGIFEI